MLSHCLKYQKIQKVIAQVLKTKIRRIMILPNCVVCNSKKSQNSSKSRSYWVLSSLRIKTPLNKIPLVIPLLL